MLAHLLLFLSALILEERHRWRLVGIVGRADLV